MPSSLVGPLTILVWLFIGFMVLGVVFTVVWAIVVAFILKRGRE